MAAEAGAPAQQGPGRWLYVLAAVLLIGGIVGAIISLWGALDPLRDLERFAAPGEEQVSLDEAGVYGIYIERERGAEGSLADFRYFVAAENGERVEVGTTGGETFHYDIGDREGRLVARFSIEEAGLYTVAAEAAEGVTPPPAVVTVGRHDFRGFFYGIFGVLAFTGLALAGAIVWLVVFLVRWSRRRPPKPFYAPQPPPSSSERGTS